MDQGSISNYSWTVTIKYNFLMESRENERERDVELQVIFKDGDDSVRGEKRETNNKFCINK